MTSKLNDPLIVAPEDIDPGHDWSRALRSPGSMNVDFEERINFRRLHDYRLGRTRVALQNSDLGSLLTFDNNNIRYITSTAIGEWARDKMCRFALLPGDGDPHLWDFGSAAAHQSNLCAVAQALLLSCGHGRTSRHRFSGVRVNGTRGSGDQRCVGAKRRGRSARRPRLV